MPFVSGDRVRLFTAAPVRKVQGPALGAVGTVMTRDAPVERARRGSATCSDASYATRLKHGKR